MSGIGPTKLNTMMDSLATTATQMKETTGDTKVGQAMINSVAQNLPPAAQEQFRQGMADRGFSVQGDPAMTNPQEAEANLTNAIKNGDTVKIADAIANFLASVGDENVLGKLMIEMATMGRQQALDSRLAAREAARSQLGEQAAETRQAATKALIGAVIAGAISMVASVVSIVGGISQMGAAAKGLSSATQADKLSQSASQAGSFAKGSTGATQQGAMKMEQAYKGMADTARTAAQGTQNTAMAQNMVVQGVTGLVNAMAQMIKGGLDAGAKMDEARGMDMAAEAQIEQSNADMGKKVMDELEELIRTVIQFIKEMNQAEADLMQSMTRV